MNGTLTWAIVNALIVVVALVAIRLVVSTADRRFHGPAAFDSLDQPLLPPAATVSPPVHEPRGAFRLVEFTVDVADVGVSAALVPAADVLAELGYQRAALSTGLDFVDSKLRRVSMVPVADNDRQTLLIRADSSVGPYLAYRIVQALGTAPQAHSPSR